MKKIKKHMLILLAALLMVTPAVMGQNMSKKEAREKARAEKKAAQQAAEAANTAKIRQLIEQRHFVLEANFLSNKSGGQISVTSTLNFVMVEKDKATFQFGEGSRVGYNGVGGLTMDGQVRNYEYTTDKKGMIHLDFQISTSAGTIFVSMMITPASSDATATISSMGSKKLYYRGKIVAPEESRVYKGMSI